MVQLFQHGGFRRFYFWPNKLVFPLIYILLPFSPSGRNQAMYEVFVSRHIQKFECSGAFLTIPKKSVWKDLFLNQEGEKCMTRWCSKKFKDCLKSNEANPFLPGTRNSIETGESRRAELVSVKLCLSEVCRDCHISERSTHLWRCLDLFSLVLV